MTSAARSIAAKTLMLGLLPALIAAAPAAATEAPSPAPATPNSAATAPTPLSASASASPQIQPPEAPPQMLVLQAPTGPGKPGMARGEGKVARERPVTFLFHVEADGLFSIGVSSPQNAARIMIYLGESTQAVAGTSQTDGAIRWSTTLDSGARVKIVVHTAGEEIPFRVEVIAGPGSI